MNKKKNTTIKDVAELANVSLMTVSRVLNNESLVKSATQEKVNSAIKALNYRPNIMARKLAGGKGFFIGLLYRNPSPAYLSELLLGSLNSCRERGHYMIVEKPIMSEDMVATDHIEMRFQATGIQAVMLAPPLSDDRELIDTIKRLGLCYVSISPGKFMPGELSVGINDRLAAKEMTDYLISLGHKRIACIRGPNDHSASKLRFDGYKDAIENSQLAFSDTYVVQGDFTYLSGMQAAKSLLSRADDISAIFACNDDMAAGAVAAINQAGLRVPEDISVAGFDDTQSAAFVWPPLTTVKQPIKEMAEKVIEIVEHKLSGAKPSTDQVVLDHQIIVRQSTSKPKDNI